MDVLQHFVISHFGGFINDFRSLVETIQKHFYLTDVDKEILFFCLKRDMYEKPIRGQYRTESFLKQKFDENCSLCPEMVTELDNIRLCLYHAKKLVPDYIPVGYIDRMRYEELPDEYTGHILRTITESMSICKKQSQPAIEVNHKKESKTKCCDPKPHKKNERASKD